MYDKTLEEHYNLKPLDLTSFGMSKAYMMIEDSNVVSLSNNPKPVQHIVHSDDFNIVWNKRNKQAVGCFKKDYKITDPKDGIEAVESMLVESDLDLTGLERKMETAHNEALLEVTWRLPSQTIKIGPPQLNDICALQIKHKTSFNGTWAWQIGFNTLRLKCLNGMVGAESVSLFKKKNTKSLDPESAKKHLADMVDAFQRQEKLWSRWSTQEVPDALALYIFGKAAGCKIPSELWNKETKNVLDVSNKSFATNPSFQYMKDKYFLVNKLDIGDNLWSVFNTLTDWSTHGPIEAEHSDKVISIRERREKKVAQQLRGSAFTDGSIIERFTYYRPY